MSFFFASLSGGPMQTATHRARLFAGRPRAVLERMGMKATAGKSGLMGSRRIFCFGLGYVALALSRALRRRGWDVSGSVRNPTCTKMHDIRCVRFDSQVGRMQNGFRNLDGVEALLSCIPPQPRIGDPVLYHHRRDIVRLRDINWIGYLSTTGVYGNHQGALVDETTVPNPTTERARRRLVAEHAWRRLGKQRAIPVHIFRLAGIYGPERNPLQKIAEKKIRRIIRSPGHVFGRIHRADIVQALLASIKKNRPGAHCWNLCDDQPAEPAHVLEYACRLSGRSLPPAVSLEHASVSDFARSFWLDHKRVSNRRLRGQLGVQLRYPTYREGLQALYRQQWKR